MAATILPLSITCGENNTAWLQWSNLHSKPGVLFEACYSYCKLYSVIVLVTELPSDTCLSVCLACAKHGVTLSIKLEVFEVRAFYHVL